eukprot:scaffold1341_cov178-Amphora_coffeaeformis.AAC.34
MFQRIITLPRGIPLSATRTRRLLSTRRVDVAIGTNQYKKINNNKPFTVPLTVADLHLRHEQLPFAYFFDETLDANALEESLTTVLQQEFAVAAGRLSACYRSIDCAPQHDTVPLSFCDIPMTLAEWKAAKENQGHKHRAGRGEFPKLLPIFDPLFCHKNNANGDANADLLSVRVTYFTCGATCLGVNMNHCLADTASCVHFVETWGKEMRRQHRVSKVSWERAQATVSGMMTADIVDLMGIAKEPASSSSSSFLLIPDWVTSLYTNESVSELEKLAVDKPPLIEHEYLPLHFSIPVLKAMKAHGMEKVRDDAFISTNDMVSAVGWLLKRQLSQEEDWGISVVVNLRGRCGVGTFTDTNVPRTGLFGNAITNVVAEMEPTTGHIIRKRDARKAAYTIRQAMQQALLDMPERIARSRLGKRSDTIPSANTFSTTSWGQLSPWSIRFGEKAPISGFHGQPSHPLPTGRTFASVIHSNADGGCTYDLFLPSDQVAEARRLHAQLCASYLSWDEKTNIDSASCAA